MIKTLKQLKKIIVAIIGFSLILVGLAMIFLPGPAFIVIPAGLAILASEFLWARRLLDKFKNRFKQEIDKRKNKK